jgi:hypothetical protein
MVFSSTIHDGGGAVGSDTVNDNDPTPDDGGKVFNVVNDWYFTTPDGITHGPFSKPKEAMEVLRLMRASREAGAAGGPAST